MSNNNLKFENFMNSIFRENGKIFVWKRATQLNMKLFVSTT